MKTFRFRRQLIIALMSGGVGFGLLVYLQRLMFDPRFDQTHPMGANATTVQIVVLVAALIFIFGGYGVFLWILTRRPLANAAKKSNQPHTDL